MANRESEDLLASDDELPYEYEEVCDLPAYLNDNRFENVDFPWIDNKKFIEKCLPCKDEEGSSSDYEDESELSQLPQNHFTNEEQKNYNKVLEADQRMIMKGILKKQDLYCINCVATASSKTTLLWLINFFMQKDMQSEYKFLRSCLVGNISNQDLFLQGLSTIDDVQTHNLKIVLKV